MSPYTGRPVIGQSKTNDIKVRIDDETYNKLSKYCQDHKITRADAIRQEIHLLLKK